MPLTRLELEQIRNAAVYDDGKTMGIAAESGIDHGEDFNYVITQIKNVTGKAHWYESPDKSLADLNADIVATSGVLQTQIDQNASDIDALESDVSTLQSDVSTLQSDVSALETDVSQINTFIGRADGESNPVYSSTHYVSQSGSLESAIGELDFNLYTVAQGILGDLDWTEVFNNGSGLLEASEFDVDINLDTDTKFMLKDSGDNNVYEVSDTDNLVRRLGKREIYVAPSNLAVDAIITIPNSATYTTGDTKFRNLQVFVGGALWNPGTGNDYLENNSTSIQIKHNIRKDTIVTFRIFG